MWEVWDPNDQLQDNHFEIMEKVGRIITETNKLTVIREIWMKLSIVLGDIIRIPGCIMNYIFGYIDPPSIESSHLADFKVQLNELNIEINKYQT